MRALFNRVVAITGASRGIGKQIALRCAQDGARVALIARSGAVPSHASLQGTLQEVAQDVKLQGGTPLILQTDISDYDSVKKTMAKIADTFGTLDVLVNNASALYIGADPERAKVVFRVNLQGTLNMIEAARPLMKESTSSSRHILSISPPVATFQPAWGYNHPPYTASKYAMTMLTLGYAHDTHANTLWPRKLYHTAATERLERETGQCILESALDPRLFAEAAYKVLTSETSGISFLDSELVDLPATGIDDIFI